MRAWQHSHNLKQTTLDRLGGVIGELKAERASLQTPERTLSASEQAQLERVDKALTLVEEALATLR